MRNVILGSFAGFVLAAAFLAACGGGGGVAPQADLEDLTQQVTEIQTRLAALEDLLVHFSRAGTDVTVTGANLHVVNGLDDTATVNGLGNVILGYNEPRAAPNIRSGSHMLVVGTMNNFSSYGGVVVGEHNETSAAYASVSGGWKNRATGRGAAVSGGRENTASGEYAAVSGGYSGSAMGNMASVNGGQDQEASGFCSSVNGGRWCDAEADYSSVGGGYNRDIPDAAGGANDNHWRGGDLGPSE